MEVLQSEEHVILVKDGHSLWYPRAPDGVPVAKRASHLGSIVGDVICLGTAHLLLGRVEIQDGSPYLLLVGEQAAVGAVPSVGEVYRVCRVTAVPLLPEETDPSPPLSEDFCRQLQPCNKHPGLKAVASTGGVRGFFSSGGEAVGEKGKALIGRAVKSASNSLASATNQVTLKIRETSSSSSLSSSSASLGGSVRPRQRERFFRRRGEEMMRLLNEPNSLFFCPGDGDLTRSIQDVNQPSYDPSLPLFKRADDRYFWNRVLMEHLLEALDETSASQWVIPVVMGYVEVATREIDLLGPLHPVPQDKPWCDSFTLALISRRSRYRAGTRYRCRGVDDAGRVANYVQTEQIMKYSHHTMSVTFLRGSVPVYWSQPGLKYRPAPRLNRSYWESHEAFVKHFEMELESFHRLCIVNLVERRGPEDILGREYLRHVLDMDSPKLDYVAFDFHEYCRGLRFGNVSFLVAAVLELMKYLSFCWVDSQGFICQQRGAFRVSCMDCLDRTNVVQAAFGKTLLEWQFTKLGLVPPSGRLAPRCEQLLQGMWANNGDAISRQYTGTNALKGDYTRTGERRLAGLMRDGVNSASRYYLSQFRDAYRQAAFDLLQGRPLDPSLLGLEEDEDPTCQMEVAPQPSATMDRVREVMDNVRRQLLEDEEPPIGTWGLRDGEGVYDSASTEEEDVDVILILTRNAYVVAWLDDTLSSFSECEWVPLRSLQSIDLSLTELRLTFRACPDSSTPASDGAPPFTLGRFQCPAPDLPTTDIPLRSHLFRSSRFRFFNNAPLLINSDEEKAESLRTIAETFCAVHPSLCDDDFQYAFHHPSLPPLPSTPLRLPSPTPCRKHLRSTSPKISPPSLAATDTPPPRHPQPPSTISISSIKQFGGRVCSRALGNVTSGLSRLHPRSLQGKGRREGAEEQKVRPEQLPSFVLTPENEQQLQDQDHPCPSTFVSSNPSPSLEYPYVLASCGLVISPLQMMHSVGGAILATPSVAPIQGNLPGKASLDFSPLTSSHSMPLLPSSGPSLAPPAAPVPASSPLSLSSSRSSGDLSLEVPPPNGSSRGPTQAPPSTPDPRSPFRLLARGVQSLVGGGATRCKIPADDEETRALEERKMRCKSRIMEL